MSLSLSHQSTFTFDSKTYFATSVQVEAAQPEIVNMTAHNDASNVIMMVPTGGYLSAGGIEVEAFGMTDPMQLVGKKGEAVFATPLGNVSRTCICAGASVSGQVGDLLRVRFSLTPTDYQGT